MNRCIYRQVNTCIKCNNNSLYDTNYCFVHKNNNIELYEIINNSVKSIDKITQEDIYSIFSYIYENKNIYTKDIIFKSCLIHLFSKKIYLENIYPHLDLYDLTIKNVIEKIYLLNQNTYNLIKYNKNILEKIKYFLIRNFIKPEKYTSICYNNIIDPFTFEPIETIPKQQQFIYKDKSNNFYIFDILELYYYITNYNNNTNPFTKEIFDNITLLKIKRQIEFYNLDINTIVLKYKPHNIIQSFTKVSQELEKIGFYNNVEWFLKLSKKQIQSIIRSFHYIAIDNPENLQYIVNIHENNYHIDFANEIIKLFENGNSRFLLCCLFIKALALHSEDFYNNLPSWINDINTPQSYILNIRDIYYLVNILEY